jgi:hypothetical protein
VWIQLGNAAGVGLVKALWCTIAACEVDGFTKLDSDYSLAVQVGQRIAMAASAQRHDSNVAVYNFGCWESLRTLQCSRKARHIKWMNMTCDLNC